MDADGLMSQIFSFLLRFWTFLLFSRVTGARTDAALGRLRASTRKMGHPDYFVHESSYVDDPCSILRTNSAGSGLVNCCGLRD